MEKLKQTILSLRSKLDGLKKRGLKESPTRTIVVDPLLESLGWDIRDPDEVELEYPTIDNKFVDYALKINRKPVLLVEAKPLDDPLDDVKGITQVVGYAANDGIVWCVLTNGVVWKVYRSVEKCAAPDKLMYEVSLDPKDDHGTPLDDVVQHLWRLSREEMARGTLDDLGEQTFTDGKVRKGLDALMANPPRTLLNMITKSSGDTSLKPQLVKDSLARLWSKNAMPASRPADTNATSVFLPVKAREASAVHKAWATRRARGSASYTEQHHTSGKPQEVLSLYRAIDDFCMTLDSGGVERRYLAKTINYITGTKPFCSLHILHSGVRVWLQLKYGRIENPPAFARDMTGKGHWGTGDLELSINSRSQIDEVQRLIRRSFEECKAARRIGR